MRLNRQTLKDYAFPLWLCYAVWIAVYIAGSIGEPQGILYPTQPWLIWILIVKFIVLIVWLVLIPIPDYPDDYNPGQFGDMDGKTCLLSKCALHYPEKKDKRARGRKMTLPEELNFMSDKSFKDFWHWFLDRFDEEFVTGDKTLPIRVVEKVPEMDIETPFWLKSWAIHRMQEYRRKFLRLSDDP